MLPYDIKHTKQFSETLTKNGYRLIAHETKGKQIRSMQCWEYNAEVEDRITGEVITIQVLQSYRTLVAYKMNGKVYRCGWFSRTTSKQTTIWERM